jgi:predicted transcriptional regulator
VFLVISCAPDVFGQIRTRYVTQALEMMSMDIGYSVDEEDEEMDAWEETDEEGELLEMEEEEELDNSDLLEEEKYEKQLWSDLRSH